MVLNYNLVEEMSEFILERDNIRIRKELGDPKPWTQDPILQAYRFCNVQREDDKVTKWFAQNWRHSRYWNAVSFVPAIILGRTINWPDTLKELEFPYYYERERFIDILDKRQARGEKVYTGAYMITAGPTGVRKNEWVIGNAQSYFEHPPQLNTLSLEHSWEMLQDYPCVGPFIAGQIIADLKYTDLLRAAKDWYDWAALGPGSTRGLNRLYGRPLHFALRQDEGLKEMMEVRARLKVELHLQDIQNCLCEFDKYQRVKLGQGKPRSSYPGKA